MKKLGRAVSAAAKGFAAAFDAGHYEAAGKRIRCSHCEGETFKEQHPPLQSATALVCDGCGLIQWFAKRPECQQS